MCEGEGVGTPQKISQDNEGRRDGENPWAPLELAFSGMVAVIQKPVSAFLSDKLNKRIKGVGSETRKCSRRQHKWR